MKRKLQDYARAGEKGLSAAVSRALDDLQSGDTLLLGKGIHHFYAEGTQKKYYCISNNDKGEKKIVFPISHKENITIDGEGAELIFHGEILPFVLDQCKEVCVKNLKMDYAAPMYVQAEIVHAEKNYYELQFDKNEFNYQVKNGKIWICGKDGEWEKEFRHCLTIEMDGHQRCPSPYKPEYITETVTEKDHGFLSRLFRPFAYKDLGNGRLGVSGDAGFTYQSGNYWIGTFHYDRKNPGIFVNESKDIYLENIDIFHALAMGVISQLCENITLDCVNTRPREGSKRFLSVCADSTHFVNCRGKIRVQNCLFTNMLDDALNIHGIYHKIMKKTDDHTILCGVGHFQQVGIMSYRKDDRIHIVDGKTGAEKAVYTVRKSELLDEESIVLETQEVFKGYEEGDVVENLSANPEIEISDCECGNNRPRGFLLSSPKKTLVENCTFYNMYEGIHIGGGSGGWYESGSVSDITIQNNQFRNSAFAGGVAINIQPEFEQMENVKHFCNGIVIKDNLFVQAEKRLLNAYASDQLVFENNRFRCDDTLPSHPADNLEGIKLINCERVNCRECVCC